MRSVCSSCFLEDRSCSDQLMSRSITVSFLKIYDTMVKSVTNVLGLDYWDISVCSKSSCRVYILDGSHLDCAHHSSLCFLSLIITAFILLRLVSCLCSHSVALDLVWTLYLSCLKCWTFPLSCSLNQLVEFSFVIGWSHCQGCVSGLKFSLLLLVAAFRVLSSCQSAFLPDLWVSGKDLAKNLCNVPLNCRSCVTVSLLIIDLQILVTKCWLFLSN